MSYSHRPDPVDEAVIDLGSASDPLSETSAPGDQPAVPPTSKPLRYLITVVASAAITLAATLLVTSGALSDVPEPPANIDELKAAIFQDLTAAAEGRDVELFSIRSFESANTVLEAGEYQVLMKCGQLSRFHDQHQDFRMEIAVEGYRHESLLPCPSQVLWLEHRFEFVEPSPFMVRANIPIGSGGNVVGVAVFAVEDDS